MQDTVLILGPTGRFGRHAAEAFWNAGWRVRLFDRTTDDLMESASGADVIVNGWNPPYADWATEVPRLTARVIEAAKSSGATVIVPGNVYVYGAGSPETLDARTPHDATNPLGRIRIEMENAYRASGVPTILLRAGDFIDTEASGNWFDGVITAKANKGLITAPGASDVPHAWAYLPDLARAAVALAERRDTLATFEDVPFAGFTLSFDNIAAIAESVAGEPMEVRDFQWWALRLAAPFWRTGRRLLEMRYLWDMPHRIDGARLAELLPAFRPTDPPTAVASALDLDLQVYPDQPMPRRGAHVPAE